MANYEAVPSNLTIGSPPKFDSVNGLTAWLKLLVQSLNQWVGTTSSAITLRPTVGLDADLPPISPGTSGRQFFATDTKKLYLDDGMGNWSFVQFT